MQNWEKWEGNNKFYCNGRLMAGPNVNALGFTFSLLFVPSVLFIAVPGMDFTSRSDGYFPLIAVSAGLVLTSFFLFRVAMSDPGVIPRKEKPPTVQFTKRPATQQTMSTAAGTSTLKYCDTCRIIRPPRCVHCSLCNNCVEVFDHHCPWIGTCVGKRNYRLFCVFVGLLSFQVTFVLVMSIRHLKVLVDEHVAQGVSGAFGAALADSYGISLVLIIYCSLVIWFVVGLFGYHMFLVSTGQTTNEQLKGQHLKEGNSFNRGVLNNCRMLCCSNHETASDVAASSTAPTINFVEADDFLSRAKINREGTAQVALEQLSTGVDSGQDPLPV